VSERSGSARRSKSGSAIDGAFSDSEDAESRTTSPQSPSAAAGIETGDERPASETESTASAAKDLEDEHETADEEPQSGASSAASSHVS